MRVLPPEPGLGPLKVSLYGYQTQKNSTFREHPSW